MKIGVSSYSYSQYLRSGKLNLMTVIAKAAEMGFEAIEFTDLPGDTYESRKALALQLKEEAARQGIELSAYVCGANLYRTCPEEQQAEVDRLKGELDLAAALGVKLFRHDVIYSYPTGVSYDRIVEVLAPAMRQVAEYGQQLGIRTMIENHGYIAQDYDRVEKLHHAVDHPNFGLLIDIGNFLCADQDNTMAVSRLAPLAFHVHLKDFVKLDYYSDASKEGCFQSRGCNYLRGTAVGYGDARAAQCMQILKKAGYDGYADIEFEGPEDCVEELEKGLAFYRSLKL